MAQTIGFKATADVKKWQKEMRRIEGGLPLAAAEMLNTVGGMAHAQSIKNLRKHFKIRNKYTEGSMQAHPVNYKRSNGQYRDVEKMKYISATWSKYLPLHDEGGRQTPQTGAESIPMPTSKGRPSDSKPIPNRLRLGPRGSAQGAEFGSEGNPMKLFALPSGIYFRQGKAKGGAHWGKQRKYDRLFGATSRTRAPVRPLVMIRTLGVKSQMVKATHWHSGAMKEFGTQENMATAYAQAARRILGGDTVAF